MVRPLRSTLILATLFVASLTAFPAAAVIVAGDIDSSGQVDAVDVQLVINAALGIPVAYDTNVDQDVAKSTNAVDVQLVINAALGISIDTDGDGLADAAEANVGSNPDLVDTDGGGVDDATEVLLDHTNPLNAADDTGGVPPTANFSAAPTTGSYPLDVQFTDTSTAGSSPITQWLWNFGDGATSVAQNPLHTYTTQGTYSVALTVHNAAGQDSMVKSSYINVTQPAQPQNHWVSLLDGFWDDQNNWSLGHVPTASELAVVDLSAQNVTVTVRNYTTVYNAQIKENLTIIAGGTLLEAGQATVDSTLTITGGGTLQVDGAGATFTANGTVQLQNHRINVRNGGLASFPTVTTFTYNTNANPTLFDVSGAGSTLDLSHVTSFTFNDGISSYLTAYISVASSGHIDLSSLTTVNLGTNHRFEFDVSSGGTISADLLQTNSGLNVYTATSGSLSLPGLTALSNTSVSGTGSFTAPNATTATPFTLSISGGTFSADNLASIGGGSLTLYGTATANLIGLTSLTETSIDVENTASLTLPVLTSMTSTTNKTLYLANTATFSAASLTSLTNIILQVRSGATLTLPITSYLWNYNVNPTALDASGAGSQLNLPNLTGLTFNHGSAAYLTLYVSASSGGTVSLPVLVNVTLGASHSYELDATSGGTISANNLVTSAGLRLYTTTPSTMTLPGLTSVSGVTISGTGALVLPNVTTGAGLTVSISGGSLTANNLTSVSGGSLAVYGTATMTLPGLTTLTDTSLDVESSATLSLPNVTSITSTTSKTLYVANSTSTFSAPLLTSLTNIIIQVRSGATLTLPITSYLWNYNVNPTAMDASGTGSQLNLPNLAGFTFNYGSAAFLTLYVSASSGGTVNLPALVNVTLGTSHSYELDATSGGAISADNLVTSTGLRLYTTTPSTMTLPGLTSVSGVTISGTGTLVLPNVTTGAGLSVSISGGSLTANNLTSVSGASLTVYGTATTTLPGLTTLTNTSLDVENSATLSLPNVTSITSTTSKTLYVANSTSTFSAPLLTSLTNIIIQVRSGATLTLPITSYLWNYNVNPTVMDASGTGSQLSLPNLAGFTFNYGSAAFLTLYVSASSNGTVSLPALVNVTLGANHSYELDATSGGAISADNLVTNAGLRLYTTSPSTMTLPGLTSLSGVTISGTGALSLPNATTAAGLSVSISGGSVTAAALTSITGGSSLTVYGTSSSLSLPALTTLTDTSFDIENTGSISIPNVASITSSTSKTLYIANGATFTAGSLTSVTNLILQVRSGAVLSLPITSYNWTVNSNPTGLDASGSGSQLNLTSLTHLTFNDAASSFITFYASATSGGHIDAAALNTVTLGTNHSMNFTANGAGSQITITALPATPNVTTTALNGGVIL